MKKQNKKMATKKEKEQTFKSVSKSSQKENKNFSDFDSRDDPFAWIL